MKRVRTAVFVSGGGTNLQALIDAETRGDVKSAEIVLVVSNHADAYALKRAEKAGIATFVSEKKDYPSQAEFERSLREALEKAGIDKNAVQLIDNTDREIANGLMRLNAYVDLLIPRGSAGLINSVTKNATVPVIQTGAGNCHIYVEKTADFDMAVNIIENAKIQKPSACNSVEKILVDSEIANEFLPKLLDKMTEDKVEVRGDELSQKADKRIKQAIDEDWDKEYNDLIMSVKVVGGIDEALDWIENHSTKHSEAIITTDNAAAEKFLKCVDSAAVYVNSSIRFSDGFEFGMGAEIGISTQKLHARGPMGLRELYTVKYRVLGNGQIRK